MRALLLANIEGENEQHVDVTPWHGTPIRLRTLLAQVHKFAIGSFSVCFCRNGRRRDARTSTVHVFAFFFFGVADNRNIVILLGCYGDACSNFGEDDSVFVLCAIDSDLVAFRLQRSFFRMGFNGDGSDGG